MSLPNITRWFATIAVLAIPSLGLAVTSADFTTLAGVATSDKVGRSVATGDFNADGYDDIVTGAPNNPTGYISIVYGSASLPAATTLSTSNSVIITGNGSIDFFGVTIATGDVNGDGYDDIAVGATGDTAAGGANAGAVFLFYGQAAQLTSGSASSLGAKFLGGGAATKTGSSLAMGNINGDAYDDLLVGALGENGSGAVTVVYGQSTAFTGLGNFLTSLPKFTGEAGGNAFGGSMASGEDINGDGYDDFIVGAPFNNDGATAAGAVYVIFGRSASFSGSTAASTLPEFTGEANADKAGTYVALGDVTGDGFADILMAATGNDAGASDAGAIYVATGSASVPTSGTFSLSTMSTKFTGTAASEGVGVLAALDVNTDGTKEIVVGSPNNAGNGMIYLIGGDRTSASLATFTSIAGATGLAFGTSLSSGDLNGDSFLDLLVGGTGYSSNTGAVYIGVFYLDTDLDGVAGSGLISSLDPSFVADCNDADATVTENQTHYPDSDGDGLGDPTGTTVSVCSSTPATGYAANADDTDDTVSNAGVEIDGDGIDNDGDGLVDEINTVEENETHPYYGTLDAGDADEVSDTITNVSSTTDGLVSVTFADDSIYHYAVFNGISSAVDVERYKSTGYGIVLHPKGKKIALLNLLTGEVVKTITLSSKQSYSQNSLKLLDVRNDGSKDVVVTSRKNKSVLLTVLKMKVSNGKLSKQDSATAESSKVAVSKTKTKKKTIQLKNSSGKALFTFSVNKNYQLVSN